MKWRLNSLARCLGMPIPKPFRAPYIPGITVLIPHFQEDILVTKAELCSGQAQTVPLIDWIKARYRDEFEAFQSRMESHPDWGGNSVAAGNWDAYTDQQWELIGLWASITCDRGVLDF